jgi:hypothetical protein
MSGDEELLYYVSVMAGDIMPAEWSNPIRCLFIAPKFVLRDFQELFPQLLTAQLATHLYRTVCVLHVKMLTTLLGLFDTLSEEACVQQ